MILTFNFNFWLGWHSHMAVFNIKTQIPLLDVKRLVSLKDFLGEMGC